MSEQQQTQASLAVITESFNCLSKKTDVQKRCDEMTSRLAIAEAGLLKSDRKY